MEPLTEPMSMAWPFPFVPQDWEQTPTAVQAYVHTLRDELMQLRTQIEALEARLTQTSTTSHRPPLSDCKRSRGTAMARLSESPRPPGRAASGEWLGRASWQS